MCKPILHGTIIATVAALTAALAAATAFARPPAVETMPASTVQVFSGADSPCPFDITLTGNGTVTITTFFDNAGTPVRQSVHGALTHSVFSSPGSRTLTANGPAPVHIDLASGQSVVTGNEEIFHLPGVKVVLGQAGRLTTTSDGAQLSFTGMSTVDTASLCAALAP
jgi:hypothetical protein